MAAPDKLSNATVARLFRRRRVPVTTSHHQPTAEAITHAQSLWQTAGAANSTADQTFGAWPGGAGLDVEHLPVRTLCAPNFTTDGNARADFELVRPLGVGGMGEVWQAHQPSLGRSVALKLAKQGDTAARARFVAEAKITGELHHPGIVTVHEFGRTPDGRLFYAMPENAGDLWRHALAEKSLADNLDILVRIAGAVAYAHSRGVIHRDIKPDNVLLGEYSEAMLGDWGVAASVAGDGKAPVLSPTTAFAGTPAYMAPEQALGDWKRTGFATDVYLLGAVLYEILTGTPPHAGESGPDSLARAARNEYPEGKNPSPLMRVALRTLSTRPEDRFPGVAPFLDALKEARKPRLHSLGAWAKAQTARSYARLAVLVVLLVVVAVFAYGKRHPDSSGRSGEWAASRGEGAVNGLESQPFLANRGALMASMMETVEIKLNRLKIYLKDGEPGTSPLSAAKKEEIVREITMAWRNPVERPLLQQDARQNPEAYEAARIRRLVDINNDEGPTSIIELYLYARTWKERAAFTTNPSESRAAMRQFHGIDTPYPVLIALDIRPLPSSESGKGWLAFEVSYLADLRLLPQSLDALRKPSGVNDNIELLTDRFVLQRIGPEYRIEWNDLQNPLFR